MQPSRILGPLESYSSLTDDNLAGHFSNPRKQRHLRRMGIITQEGQIVDEPTVRLYNLHKEHEKISEKETAVSLVQRSVELERKRRGELQKKLQMLAKFEMAERVRSQSRHLVGAAVLDSNNMASPSFISTINHYQDRLGLSDEQLPAFTKLISQLNAPRSITTHYSNPYALNVSPRGSHSPLYTSPTPSYYSCSNRVPRPPSSTRPEYTLHSRRPRIRKRPSVSMSTAPVRNVTTTLSQSLSEDKVHANVELTLCYLGGRLHLESTSEPLSLIEVLQQHCGGNTLPLYRGKLKAGDLFKITSKRHIGMRLGFSFYIDGIIDSRMSACCEYKYQPGKLLGGRSAHFRLVQIDGGKPCFQCELENERKMKKAGASGGAKKIDRLNNDEDDQSVSEEVESPPSTVQCSPPSHTEKDDEYENDPFEEECDGHSSKDNTEADRPNGHQPSLDESSEHEAPVAKLVDQGEDREEALSNGAVSRELSSQSSNSKDSRKSSSTSSCHSIQSSSSSNSEKVNVEEEKSETVEDKTEEQDSIECEVQKEETSQNDTLPTSSPSVTSNANSPLSSPVSSSSIHTANKDDAKATSADHMPVQTSRASQNDGSDVSLSLPEGTSEREEEAKQESVLESGRISRLEGEIQTSTEEMRDDSKRSQDSSEETEETLAGAEHESKAVKNVSRQEMTEHNETIEKTAENIDIAVGADDLSTRMMRQGAVPQ